MADSTSCTAAPVYLGQHAWPRTQAEVRRAAAVRGTDSSSISLTRWPAPAARSRGRSRESPPTTRARPATIARRKNHDRSDPDRAPTRPGLVPVLAVVGRPNVGKSTLVNRILGRREAVVEDVPGRHPRPGRPTTPTWNGRALHRRRHRRLGARRHAACAARIAAQAEVADRRWPTPCCSSSTRRSAPPTPTRPSSGCCAGPASRSCSAANKVDDQRAEAEAAALWNLGLGEPYPVSALHGRGSGDLLDAVLDALPEPPPRVATARSAARAGSRSSASPTSASPRLLNKLAGEERVVVDDVAGTTVDPVDELVELGGQTWRFVDTAGIRRRVKEAVGARVLRLAAHRRPRSSRPRWPSCVIDAGEPITEQDLRIIPTVVEAGRALVIAFNKWDLVDEERRYYLDREIERELVQVQWAPRVNISAPHRLARRPARARRSTTALEGWETRVPTGAAQRVPRRARRRAPAPGARRQAAARSCSRTQAVDRAADVRAVHPRLPRGGLPRASSSAGCARSSASSAPRCTCSSARARSASAADAGRPATSTGAVGEGDRRGVRACRSRRSR